ncbi:MAG: hypothetical protein KAI57_04645 [Candidatus Pacebacteria bacterium]|nr:hypothetical protein [Candidatus Paceibacterota bacterium]
MEAKGTNPTGIRILSSQFLFGVKGMKGWIPHFAVVYGNCDEKKHKYLIKKGISRIIMALIPNHRDYKKWDFLTIDSKLILLVPKFYMIFGGIFLYKRIQLIEAEEE